MPRWFLIPFATLAGWFGLAYVVGDPRRTMNPAFAVAKTMLTVPHWGIMFIIGFVFITTAMLLGRSDLMAVALFLGGVMFTWWSLVFAAAALQDPRASATAPAIHGFIATMHFFAAWLVKAWHA